MKAEDLHSQGSSTKDMLYPWPSGILHSSHNGRSGRRTPKTTAL